MPKDILKGVGVILVVMSFCGCAATRGIEVRRYIDVRDRVDQDMEGNAGFLAGTPQPEDRSEFKKTRKIYVLEVSKDAVTPETVVGIEEGADISDSGMEEFVPRGGDLPEAPQEAEATPHIVISPPQGVDVERAVEPPPAFTEYKVQKDDTLQKISKKFYGSYSKWPGIYEANRNVIDDPDRIKPGIVIQIPME